jgi:serpin B
LPRFEIDPPKAVKLKPMLIALGMGDAFDASKADLSGIADMPPGERLVIDEAYHKAFVQVNEEGTEAAAATAVVGAKEASAVVGPKRVVADRPFLFFIRDKKSGAILFMGRVEKPSAS